MIEPNSSADVVRWKVSKVIRAELNTINWIDIL